MAGMFYTLEEVVEKLGKSADEIKELIRQGRLREFRDGTNLLFKVDEIEAMRSDTHTPLEQSPDEPAPLDESAEISLEPDLSGTGSSEQNLAEADTRVNGEGINVLGESSELPITEDTMSETKLAPAESAAGSSAEQSLEKIENDVNLDSFGSGSGLLDLSLQADDTSLGADILEDIYSGEGNQVNGGADAAIEVATEAEDNIFTETAPEVEESTATMPVSMVAPSVIELAPAPDVSSNSFGIILFVALAAAIYTAVVAVAAFRDVSPAILTKAQGIIWYIAIGAAVVTLIIMCIGFFLGRKSNKGPKG